MNPLKLAPKGMSSDDVKALVCRIDFYDMLAAALKECGGVPTLAIKMSNCPFEDVVNQLSQNGIRMVYMHERHMDRLLEDKQ